MTGSNQLPTSFYKGFKSNLLQSINTVAKKRFSIRQFPKHVELN